MLRCLLLASVAAGALATYSGYYPTYSTLGLGDCLLPQDQLAALRIVQRRYPGITDVAAAGIVRLVVKYPPRPILTHIRVATVPVIAQRLSYLNSLFYALPQRFYDDTYLNGLHGYLGSHLGLQIPVGALVDPLSLADIYFSGHLVYPVSVAAFNKFFVSHIWGGHGGSVYNHVLGIGGGVGIRPGAGLYGIPYINGLISRIRKISLTPIPAGFRQIVLPGSSLVAGGSLLPTLSKIGLPVPVQPTVTIPGLVDYLVGQRVPVQRFISRVRVIRIHFRRLIRRIKLRRIVRFLPYVSPTVIRQDLLPLLALRYHTFPLAVRKNLGFPVIAPGFLRTFGYGGYGHGILNKWYRSRVVNRVYVTRLLRGFDTYVHGLLKGYNGKLWASGYCN